MSKADWHESKLQLLRTQERLRMINQQFASRKILIEALISQKRIASRRIDPPEVRPLPSTGPDPFLQAIARRYYWK